MENTWKLEVDRRLNEIEKLQAVHSTEIATIKTDLKAIKDNTNRIIWILLTAIIGAVLKLVLTGGI